MDQTELLDHLESEHRDVERMLDDLAESEPGDERDELIAELRSALATHMAVEERFLYPIVADVLDDDDAHEGENEHELARLGLDTLASMADAPGFGAAVAMLRAGIDHHVHEEEDELFPELRDKAADRVAALGSPDQLEQAVQGGTDAGATIDLRDEAVPGDSADEADGPTKAELYERAKEQDIPGRSQMTKEELAEALGDG